MTEGWWTFLGDLGHLLFLRPVPVKAYRDAGLAQLVFGNSGGQARKLAKQHVLSGMKHLHEAAEAQAGSEYAAQILARLLLSDSNCIKIPKWLQKEFEYHDEAVRECLLTDRTAVPAQRKGSVEMRTPQRRAKL